ncbi:MAG: hypothetical protein KatS3mg102_2160 [Planctomycetota bacterium]|nr:MAG: hypothetical protein KatS3mg102_2160 [Planctomycetota bacterium]
MTAGSPRKSTPISSSRLSWMSIEAGLDRHHDAGRTPQLLEQPLDLLVILERLANHQQSAEKLDRALALGAQPLLDQLPQLLGLDAGTGGRLLLGPAQRQPARRRPCPALRGRLECDRGRGVVREVVDDLAHLVEPEDELLLLGVLGVDPDGVVLDLPDQLRAALARLGQDQPQRALQRNVRQLEVDRGLFGLDLLARCLGDHEVEPGHVLQVLHRVLEGDAEEVDRDQPGLQRAADPLRHRRFLDHLALEAALQLHRPLLHPLPVRIRRKAEDLLVGDRRLVHPLDELLHLLHAELDPLDLRLMAPAVDGGLQELGRRLVARLQLQQPPRQLLGLAELQPLEGHHRLLVERAHPRLVVGLVALLPDRGLLPGRLEHLLPQQLLPFGLQLLRLGQLVTRLALQTRLVDVVREPADGLQHALEAIDRLAVFLALHVAETLGVQPLDLHRRHLDLELLLLGELADLVAEARRPLAQDEQSPVQQALRLQVIGVRLECEPQLGRRLTVAHLLVQPPPDPVVVLGEVVALLLSDRRAPWRPGRLLAAGTGRAAPAGLGLRQQRSRPGRWDGLRATGRPLTGSVRRRRTLTRRRGARLLPGSLRLTLLGARAARRRGEQRKTEQPPRRPTHASTSSSLASTPCCGHHPGRPRCPLPRSLSPSRPCPRPRTDRSS